MKELDVKQTAIDKAINYLAPTWGARRMRSRYVMAAAGAYIGASRSRKETRDFPARLGDANADLLQDLPELRNRSSWHVRNTPMAAGAINTNCYHVVGPGLKLQSRIDRHVLSMTEDQAEEWQDNAEKEWRLFAESTDCDVARKQNVYQQQDTVLRAELERGDVFALRTYKKRKTSPYGTAIQLIEADRICNDPKVSLRNTKNLIAGIVLDDDGEPTGYHIRTTHPGTNIGKYERQWVNIPAYSKSGLWNVQHIYKQLRPGMARGVPYISGIIEQLYQINKYINGTVAAAVIQSYFTIIMQEAPGSAGPSPLVSTSKVGADQKTDEGYKLESAGIMKVKNVQDVKFAQPNQPSLTFNAFLQGMAELLGPALGIPYELLVQHFQKSYSSARTSLLVAWKMFSARRTSLEAQFCNPVYEAQMHEAVLLGRIVAPGFLNNPLKRKAYLGAIWVGPTPGSIDPLREIKATEKRIELNLNSTSNESAALGFDYDKNLDQIKKEKRNKKELREIEGVATKDEGRGTTDGNTEVDNTSDDEENN